jgi:hypothetical protein
MLQSILIVACLVYFVDALFFKWHIWEKIKVWGSYSKIMWLFELSFCRFCLMFHIGWVLTVLYGIAFGFEWSLLIVPFVVSGLTRMIEVSNGNDWVIFKRNPFKKHS